MNDSSRGQDHLRSPAEAAPSPSSRRRTAILVLGMHRSGTSAVSGVLNALGAAVPKKTLMGADQTNQSGYFESFALAVAHDEMLASAGSHWHDWREFDPQWARSDVAEQHRRKIKAILVEEFDDEPLILVKDPRICRFIPLMLSVLTELNFSPVAILPIRNPLEVAHSLRRRNGFGLPKSILLWLRHVLDAEFHSRPLPRCFLPYEELLNDWRHYVDRAAATIGVAWPGQFDRSDGIDRFLTAGLRHERASFDDMSDHPAVSPVACETYRILRDIAADGESGELLDKLDLLRARFTEGCRIFGPAVAAEELASADSGLIAERHSLAAAHDNLTSRYDALVQARDKVTAERDVLARDRNRLRVERDSLAAACNELRVERGTLLASRSWRMTAPLRSLANYFKRQR
ncbi:MAG TPA: sulfotransferase family protein [Xanthobacteraceae bacterium]|nr:sulfotransferase family protein [Xanthobacteraceae bacterium]